MVTSSRTDTGSSGTTIAVAPRVPVLPREVVTVIRDPRVGAEGKRYHTPGRTGNRRHPDRRTQGPGIEWVVDPGGERQTANALIFNDISVSS